MERVLGTPAREVVQPGRIRDLFSAFASDVAVTLDGNAIQVSGEPVLPHARVEDAPGGGFLLRLDRDPAITAALAQLGRNGVPVYVFYQQGRAPIVLSEILSVQEVRAALAQL